jgi:hypothetical protein
MAFHLAHYLHLADWPHAVDKQMLARLNAAFVFGMIATGLATCVFGAVIFDVGRWFSAW